MKKNLYSFAISMIAVSGFCQTGNPAPYCVSVFDNNYNMVQSVSVGGSAFNIGPAGTWMAQNSYTFFNNAVFPALPINGTTAISINFHGVGDIEPKYYGVWIDFNNNQVFDQAELVMNNATTLNTDLPVGGAPAQTVSLAINIPATAVAGITRMRLVRGQTPTGSPYAPYASTVQVLACNPAISNNAYGCTYDFQVNLLAGAVPVSNFSFTPAQVCVGKPVLTTNLSSNSPTSWTWTAAGASPSLTSTQNSTLVFNAPGIYTIGLTTANSTGVSSPSSKTITVVAAPQLTVTPAVVSICARRSTSLVVSGAATYSWSTGANSSSLAISPSVTTVYTVTGIGLSGCSATASRTVSVSSCVGIDERVNETTARFSITPNPASAEVEIHSANGESGEVFIYSLTGQLIMSQKTEGNIKLTIESLQKGIYYVTFKAANGAMRTEKLIHD